MMNVSDQTIAATEDRHGAPRLRAGSSTGLGGGDSVLDVGLRERLTGRRRLSVGCRNWRREGGAPRGTAAERAARLGTANYPWRCR